MSPTLLNGPRLTSKNAITKRLVVFLHGVGADGNDLISLAPMLDLPDTEFFSPDAPFPFDMAPFGRQWFSLADRSTATIAAGVARAAPILNATIDAEMARLKLTPSQVALVGFSQGAMMAMYIAPRRSEKLAGVVAMSGALISGDTLGAEIHSRPPVCIIHGTQDEVVPFAAMGNAEATLAQHHVPVEAHARPMLGHGIDEEAITITHGFLKKVFGV